MNADGPSDRYEARDPRHDDQGAAHGYERERVCRADAEQEARHQLCQAQRRKDANEHASQDDAFVTGGKRSLSQLGPLFRDGSDRPACCFTYSRITIAKSLLENWQ